MYHVLDARVRQALRDFIRRQYGLDLPVVTEQPPRIEMGEVASPVCFELAKRLKRAPRQIAQEIVSGIGAIEGVARWEVAGGGYLNAYLDRSAFFRQACNAAMIPAPAEEEAKGAAPAEKTIVEHTNINPNKAAHIGHLRNAALGDAFVRLLRRAGQRVEVQNYIDNTGVQVADVVVAFLRLERKSPAEVRALVQQPRFDYLCWDLYARATQWFEEDKARLALRADTLKAIEEGHGAAAEIGTTVADAIVHCHLRTMERLGIEYDVLSRESEILRLKFWDAAFEKLQQSGAVRRATSGKNAGCWVMPLGEPAGGGDDEEEGGGDANEKIIVRSNGTVTYVGKDIAYQMWKFGLLGRDFRYTPFHTDPSGRVVWASTSGAGDPGAPAFGSAARVYNVIDSRQSYLQNIVAAGLRALGYTEQADRSVHFSYEMVALSPRCAQEMGYPLTEEEARKAYVDVSGRKGRGVKADDLLDRLEGNARAEVDARHPETPASERATIAHAIAIGALRYFLLKYTRNTVIAFDFKDALSFEGETGPYVQYAIVRARNIFRKFRAGAPALPTVPESQDAIAGTFIGYMPPGDEEPFLAAPGGNDLWELCLLAGSLGSHIEKALGAQEPAFVAKYAFQLAQAFNLFYHKHHILSEGDASRKTFLLMLTAMIERQLVAALELLGIEAPEKM